ncbi:glucokinase [Legionella spiritensis]|uniref:Glucokinase n=1 Tax=Legionella spiritensis TaxID=452 RepID=A0A0W0YYN3_LEGSP|nr:glucokinase [Legionella spiritensis]KTD61980.1 glucokinase [Legionella spiritensis]SNV34976.1 glucokinase [Legionella spiritensis]
MADDGFYAIVADIGGTNARFSRVELGSLAVDKIAVFPCAGFANLDMALSAYQKRYGLTNIKHAAIAIACPVTDDRVRMTNLHWQFSISDLQKQLGFKQLQVVNDFMAMAMSLPALTDSETIRIGGGVAEVGKIKVVLGAGTGLGVAHLVPTADGYLPLPGEAGHCDWAAQTEQEWFIQRYLARRYGRVSVERILSGPGLENLYMAIAEFRKQKVEPVSAADIARLASSKLCPLAQDAIAQFFASLGSFAGDLALSLSAFGGVYIAGGIVPKLLPFMEQSAFRARFEEKGRFCTFNSQIATCVVAAEQPGLIGAAAYLKQMMTREHYGIC